MSIELLLKAKEISLAALNGNATSATPTQVETLADKNAKHMGKVIHNMSALCSDAKRNVAMFTNEIMKLVGTTDIIGEIKREYISSTPGIISSDTFDYKPLTLVVSMKTDQGLGKGAMGLVLNREQFMRANTKVCARVVYYAPLYRLASAEEIEKFYVAAIANFALENKLPLSFNNVMKNK